MLKLEKLLFDDTQKRAGLPKQLVADTTKLAQENSQRLAPTPENVDKAKQFIFDKWQQRAVEYGREEVPFDLSGACKFASLFAQQVFGGNLKGNKLHQFVELENQIIDLTAGSRDVASMPTPYHHDKGFWGNAEHMRSLRSCSPRVSDWANEFLNKVSNEKKIVAGTTLAEDLNLRQKLTSLRKSSEGEPQSFRAEMKKLGFSFIGQGDSRMVFAINDQAVLKLSKSLWKHSQNQREVSIHNCLHDNDNFRWFARVLDYDKEKYFWLVMERVRPLSVFEVANHTKRLLGARAVELLKAKGYAPTNPASILMMLGENDELLKHLTELSEWLRGFSEALSQCGIAVDDLHSSNFGLRVKDSYDAEGDLVVLDYGD